MERTFVIIKPDGVQRGLVGEITTRLERRGLHLVGAKFMLVSPELAEKHYGVHKGKGFYEGLVKYIVSSPVLAMVWEGDNAVVAVRQTMGATNPLEATPGTIRHDFGLSTGRNLTHASDSVENAEKEIALWFKPEEIVAWNHDGDSWIFAKN
ncbi:MAG: nucleoside-diphosphate kinase [Anaerolineae bacterium]|nr:nucleoside-diphosphate kinase [Anaerolineae bacterium]